MSGEDGKGKPDPRRTTMTELDHLGGEDLTDTLRVQVMECVTCIVQAAETGRLITLLSRRKIDGRRCVVLAVISPDKDPIEAVQGIIGGEINNPNQDFILPLAELLIEVPESN